MSTISFHSYSGIGQQNSDAYHYSQSMRIGSTIRTSGQVGSKDDGEIIVDPSEQLKAAFKNVEKALVDAGGKGWSQVVSVRSYHADLDSSFEITVETFKEFMPKHRPVWVAVGVAKLAEGCIIEIEVEANVDFTGGA